MIVRIVKNDPIWKGEQNISSPIGIAFPSLAHRLIMSIKNKNVGEHNKARPFSMTAYVDFVIFASSERSAMWNNMTDAYNTDRKCLQKKKKQVP